MLAPTASSPLAPVGRIRLPPLPPPPISPSPWWVIPRTSQKFGGDRVASSLRHVRGQLLIDMTTSDPALARALATEATAKGAAALDAPVSGGDRGAREAALSIMVGGAPADFARAQPVLAVMGKTVVLQGGPGAGQLCKLTNQIAIASGMLAVCESLAFAKAAGLNLETVLTSISGGAAGSWGLSNLAPRVLRDDFAPGFYVRHFVKDLGLALAAARALNLRLPGLELAARLYDQVVAAGDADLGTQALARLYFARQVV